jgi:hypothetical protein
MSFGLLNKKSLKTQLSLSAVAVAALTGLSQSSFAGGGSTPDSSRAFTITPAFKFPDKELRTDNKCVEDSFQCGKLKKLSYWAYNRQKITVKDMKIWGSALTLKIANNGKCFDFEAQGVKTLLVDVSFPIEMKGQEYCVQSEFDLKIDLPETYEAEIKRSKSPTDALLVKLSPKLIAELLPKIEETLKQKITNTETTETSSLKLDTLFAAYVGETDKFVNSVYAQAYPEERFVRKGLEVIKTRLEKEVSTPVEEADRFLDDLSSEKWTKATFHKYQETSLNVFYDSAE